MMAFDHVFLEIARNESRAVQTLDVTGATNGTFLFREFYCTDPGCDCRRVILQVHWVEKKKVAATINYGFDPSKRRDEPQFYLDPLNPQSDASDGLLGLFEKVIATDPAYRETLRRHYKMWKAVVDDPSHPEHAKVRGVAPDDDAFQPAFPRNQAARGRRAAPRAARPSRAVGAETNQSLERMVAKTAQVDSKLQKRFRKLLEKVEALRARVLTWKQQRPDVDREIAVYQATFAQQCRLVREMVFLLDRACVNGTFSKVDRKQLVEVICSMAAEMLDNGPDDELKAIYNRHSRRDFDRESAAMDAAGVSTLKAMMESMGMEFGDERIDSLEQLKALTGAQLDALDAEEEAAAQARRAKRKKSARQLASEAKRADEERSAHKAVQEVYRSLAKALHPDREQDPVEQKRKAELMTEVNVAYEANDLLRLLELELQLEGVDVTRIEVLAEERVRHYTRVLDEQAKQLAIELDELELPFRMDIGLSPSSKFTPSSVISMIQADAETVRERIDSLTSDLKSFEEEREIKRWLKTERRGRGASRGRDDELFR